MRPSSGRVCPLWVDVQRPAFVSVSTFSDVNMPPEGWGGGAEGFPLTCASVMKTRRVYVEVSSGGSTHLLEPTAEVGEQLLLRLQVRRFTFLSAQVWRPPSPPSSASSRRTPGARDAPARSAKTSSRSWWLHSSQTL